MEIATLRTKTRKSKIGWGKYAEMTVQELLDTNKGCISWLYYNVQWMTFTDDILEEIGIKGGWRIEKPGTAPWKHERRLHNIAKYFDTTGKRKMKRIAMHKAYLRRQAERVDDKTSFTKGELQAINHGHRKATIYRK